MESLGPQLANLPRKILNTVNNCDIPCSHIFSVSLEKIYCLLHRLYQQFVLIILIVKECKKTSLNGGWHTEKIWWRPVISKAVKGKAWKSTVFQFLCKRSFSPLQLLVKILKWPFTECFCQASCIWVIFFLQRNELLSLNKPLHSSKPRIFQKHIDYRECSCKLVNFSHPPLKRLFLYWEPYLTLNWSIISPALIYITMLIDIFELLKTELRSLHSTLIYFFLLPNNCSWKTSHFKECK